MKKILLFLIDSMMPDILERCISEGKAPVFQFFRERGEYIGDCVTVFPTMTASIDCSLITGVYPDRHKVPGLVWFDPVSKKIVNYINGTRSVVSIGVVDCVENVIFGLNENHLHPEVRTIHEELEDRGFRSGSINVIAHRGNHKHKVHLPFGLETFFGWDDSKEASGPSLFTLGTLIKPAIFREIPWSWAQSVVSSCGINDKHAIDLLTEVVRSGQQPDFTLIYLPDNDHKLHAAPEQAVDHLSQVDAEISRFLQFFDSWEQALEQNVFVFVSDHGQTVVGPSPDHNIPLDDLLSSFRIPKLGSPVSPEDELVICNNERMAYLYPLSATVAGRAIERIASEPRIDLIAWKEGEKVKVKKGGASGELAFAPNGPFRDCYGRSWAIKGEADILDVSVDPSGTVRFGEYPDALSRLYGALFSQDVPMIVVTASPGYEFCSEDAPTHLGGGSHGSLHKRDSLIPLLIAGASAPFPRPARLVDLKAFILNELAVRAVTV